MGLQSVRETVEALILRGQHWEVTRLIREACAMGVGIQDDAATMYLARAERLFLLRGYEDLVRAAELLPFGLSSSVRERLLAGFVQVGFHHRAGQLAEGLGRTLTVAEVQRLVESYVDGYLQSDRIEAELLTMASDVGGALLAEWTAHHIMSMHED